MAENNKSAKPKKVEFKSEKGKKEYSFTSNGKSKHMAKDETFIVTSEMAELLVNAGYGEAK